MTGVLLVDLLVGALAAVLLYGAAVYALGRLAVWAWERLSRKRGTGER